MDTSERYHLVSERMKKRETDGRSRRRVFEIALVQFLVSAELMVLAIRGAGHMNTWFIFVLALLSIAALVSGIYGIMSSIFDRRLQIIMQAMLSEKELGRSTPTTE